jgi:hypothetical protein
MKTSQLAGTNIDNAKFKVVLRCHDCGKELNETIEMTAQELLQRWTQLVLTSGFNAGKCPDGCRSTFSDLNTNTGMVIEDVATGKKFKLQASKFLAGYFYKDDYDKVCKCRTYQPDEVYVSDKYPAVHGVCGGWLKKYKSVESEV